MKAFLASMVAMIAIGFIAQAVLTSMDRSAEATFQSERGSVRL